MLSSTFHKISNLGRKKGRDIVLSIDPGQISSIPSRLLSSNTTTNSDKTKMVKKNKKSDIVKRWDNYFQDDALENWQRLVTDLGFQEEFRSKTQCRKVSDYMLRGITVLRAVVELLQSIANVPFHLGV